MRLTGDRRVATIAAILVVLRRRAGLDPARRRRARRRRRRRRPGQPALVRQHAGRTAGRSSRSRRSSGPGSCPTGRRRSGCPGWSRPCCWSSQCLGRRPLGVLLAGVLAALLAPFQFFAFPATYLIVFLYVVTTGAWRARTVCRDAVLFLAPVVLAAPFIASARRCARATSGAFRFVAGLGRGPVRGRAGGGRVLLPDQPRHPVRAGDRRGVHRARSLPNRWFLVAWMVALFVVPNVVVVSAVEFDMNKYFQIMWIAVAILAGVADPALAAAADRGRPRRVARSRRRSSRSGTCGRTRSRSAWRRRRPRAGSRPTRRNGPSS